MKWIANTKVWQIYQKYTENSFMKFGIKKMKNASYILIPFSDTIGKIDLIIKAGIYVISSQIPTSMTWNILYYKTLPIEVIRFW